MPIETASHTEIEKKFVLRSIPEKIHGNPSKNIWQGYLEIGTNYELRVRKIVSDKPTKYTMAFKAGSGIERTEYEVSISESDFEKLWPATEGKRIEKTRYLIPIDHGLTMEVDVYQSLPGLITAEIEFPNINTAAGFVAPKELLGAKDVTGIKQFTNQSLALHGMPSRAFLISNS